MKHGVCVPDITYIHIVMCGMSVVFLCISLTTERCILW